MIDEVVNTESNQVENTIIVKTMRTPISDTLGSADNIELMQAIIDAPINFFDSNLINIIDYMWDKHWWKVIGFNMIYILYPIFLSIILVLPKKDIFEHRILGLTIPIILLIIEVHQMKLQGLMSYF